MNVRRQFTVSEYQTATNEIRSMQTQLAERRRTALKAELAKLNSAAGKIELRRQAQLTAERYLRTMGIAERVAADELRNEYESYELGRARLAAATAEMYEHARAKQAKANRARVDDYEPTPAITHGHTSYKRGLCKCNACRHANARYEANRRARKAENDHSTKQPTGQTTKDHSAAGNGGQERAEAA
ncbi:hypothetical protein FDI41_gp39 [Arthrobacter phage Piccoletto]|uniref:Uncharacterized protein n=1 Tax=Arthrobacter phage Piccoletto TaxID=2024282 RepID=A0A222Z9D1_9CAUD|nr:hypothetical protein FDI41_gp39 [Arthrobacter phage Piccoletto]ASR80670.1 hypothetical protein SEA_PICCOLETTO_39 [Arthrobacter phage Piccoletto]